MAGGEVRIWQIITHTGTVWLPETSYQALLREGPFPEPAEHPLFDREIARWNGLRIENHERHFSWIGIDWASEPDRTATMLVLPKPWLLPDGCPPGERHTRVPAPHPHHILAVSIRLGRYHATTPKGF